MPPKHTNQSLHFINNTRGIAALAVVIFHYLGIRKNSFLDDTIIENTAFWAYTGVYIFFIISGFILPYALIRGHYSLKNYGQFLAKRLLRLEPPYLLSIVFVAGISLILSKFTANAVHYTAKQLLLHLAYLNSFFGEPWINIVYWTLGIEFQYYLILGLLFPLLVYRPMSRSIVLAIFWLLPTVFGFQHDLIVSYTPYFAVGIMACFYYLRQISKLELAIWGLFVCLMAALGIVKTETLLIMLGTLALFATLNFQNQFLHFLGLISYSLYLTHTYTGIILVSWARKRTDNFWAELAIGLVAILFSLAFAVVFYWVIEKTSKRWSQEIKYNQKP